jgi:hypothetical protein
MTEIRAIREAYTKRFGGDVSAMLADLRKRQEASGRRAAKLPAKRVPMDQSQAASVVECKKVKETVMQIPVVLEANGLGGFRAESGSPFPVVAEGSTREEAVSKVRDELNKQLQEGKEVVMVEVGPNAENPWLKMAGWLKDDPLFDEWRAAVEEYRRQCDVEAGVEYDQRP